jgi:hypothetical protein
MNMKKTVFLFTLLFMAGLLIKAQTPLNTAVDFTATDANGVSHNLFSYLDDNKYVVIMFTMPN